MGLIIDEALKTCPFSSVAEVTSFVERRTWDTWQKPSRSGASASPRLCAACIIHRVLRNLGTFPIHHGHDIFFLAARRQPSVDSSRPALLLGESDIRDSSSKWEQAREHKEFSFKSMISSISAGPNLFRPQALRRWRVTVTILEIESCSDQLLVQVAATSTTAEILLRHFSATIELAIARQLHTCSKHARTPSFRAVGNVWKSKDPEGNLQGSLAAPTVSRILVAVVLSYAIEWKARAL